MSYKNEKSEKIKLNIIFYHFRSPFCINLDSGLIAYKNVPFTAIQTHAG